MRKMMTGGVLVLTLAAWSGTAAAQGSGFGIGLDAGLLGAGVQLTKSISPTFNVRVGLNSYKFTDSGTESGTDYNMDLKWASSMVLLDWHPGGGSFHLTGGYVFNNNKLDLSTPPGGAYNINGQSGNLSAGEYVRGEVTFDNGPYVGLGWGNAGDGKGFGVSFEVGAVYQGSPKVSLSANVTGVQPSDVAAEQASVADALSSYKWYPQVALGVTYAF